MIILFKIFLWIWCFPQMLLGFLFSGLVWLFLRKYAQYVKYNEFGFTIYILFVFRHWGAFTLGNCIFAGSEIFDKTLIIKGQSIIKGNDTIRHEYGHFVQSLIFGWLYLPLFAIPSLLWATIFVVARQFGAKWNYKAFYTEAFADRLGGVI